MLDSALAEVQRTGRGVMLAIRGRRQVGKSRLVEEFCRRSDRPAVSFVAARRRDPQLDLAEFAEVAAMSDLPHATSAADGYRSWSQALESITTDLESAAIVVLDEFPWLIEMDESIEGLLQRSWDRVLSRRPVLLILVGSDLAMMDALTQHNRPLYDRARPMRVDPLDPHTVAGMTGLPPELAFEAFAITGGFPNVALRWREGESIADFLTRELQDPLSALIVSGERALTAEFPESAYARPVLDIIGHGEREFSTIAQRSGYRGSSLDRALGQLVDRSVVVRDRAYSTAASKTTQYRVADAYLRFWLRYIGRNLTMIERGAGERVVERVLGDWVHWRGKAVEPVIREGVFRAALQSEAVPEAGEVGRWWRRDNSVEVDIVIGDRSPVARAIGAVGSVKWRDAAPFGLADAAALHQALSAVPGANERTLTIAASRTPVEATGIDLVYRPTDLLATWE